MLTNTNNQMYKSFIRYYQIIYTARYNMKLLDQTVLKICILMKTTLLEFQITSCNPLGILKFTVALRAY